VTEGNSRQTDPHTRARLWQSVLARTTHATRSGALHSFTTNCEVVEQGGLAFVVRVATDFERERKVHAQQRRTAANPFLPYDEDLFVADISDTHICLLNKFNALAQHVLIVTRDFEEQEDPLNLQDFEALWTCMAEIDGLCFYNAGRIAGASERHKHLQLIPLPFGPGPERVPVDPLLAAISLDGRLESAPGLPFVNAVAQLGPNLPTSPAEAAEHTLALYGEMLRAIGCQRPPAPYNLLVTRNWMLAVPRTQESHRSVPVNALGFAGSLFVRNRDDLSFVRSCGPMTILEKVSVRRP
jgi:ATP adenylyltransferase